MPTAITHDPVFNTPVSSTNTAVVRWSGTAGSTLQDCGVLIDGSNNITGIGTIASGAITSSGAIIGTQVDILAQGDLRLQDTSGNQYVAFQAAGTTTTHTLTLPAAQGSASTVLTNNGSGALTWAAVASAVTREGGQTTEATSTSTSVADLITAASLTIAATEPFTLYGIGRKTAGHASGAGFALKLNATSVAVPTASPGSTYSANVLGGHSGTQRAEGTSAYLNVQATVTNHVYGGGFGLFVFNLASGGQGALTSTCTENDPRPTAEVTDVIGTVIVANSGNTVGYDQLQVYSHVAS